VEEQLLRLAGKVGLSGQPHVVQEHFFEQAVVNLPLDELDLNPFRLRVVLICKPGLELVVELADILEQTLLLVVPNLHQLLEVNQLFSLLFLVSFKRVVVIQQIHVLLQIEKYPVGLLQHEVGHVQGVMVEIEF